MGKILSGYKYFLITYCPYIYIHRIKLNSVQVYYYYYYFIFNTAGDFEQTWQEHCHNETLLSEYADAMHHLATDHWSKRPETRIDWCRHVCHQYFFEVRVLPL